MRALHDTRRYLLAERRFISDAKWYEGLRTQKDPGEEFILCWIKFNALWFRKQWDSSCCKQCAYAERCGHKLMKTCEEFKESIIMEEKKSEDQWETTEYIECECKSFAHLLRVNCISDEKDLKFRFEMNLRKFPGHISANRNWWKSTLNYITNIFWAVIGRPLWYSAKISLDSTEAEHVAKFINQNLKKCCGSVCL